jgi:hypothetical protein
MNMQIANGKSRKKIPAERSLAGRSIRCISNFVVQGGPCPRMFEARRDAPELPREVNFTVLYMEKL